MIINAAMPKNVQVSRERVMDDPPEAIFAQISDLNNWKNWSVWYRMDPDADYEYSDPPAGVGAWYSWASENRSLGKGKLTIVEAEPARSIKTQIEFGEGMGSIDGSWELTPAEQGTKVVWTADMEFPFFQRWFSVIIEGKLGPQLESGLFSIDSVASVMGVPIAETDYAFEEVMREEMMVYYVTMEDVPFEEISLKMGEAFGILMQWLGDDISNMNNVPMTEYTKWDTEASMCSFRTLVSVQTDREPDVPVMEGTVVGGRYLKGVHMGAYENMKGIYMAAEGYVPSMGWEMTGGPIEEYITDPGMEPDTSKWITNIYWPIAPMSGDDSGDGDEGSEGDES